MLKTISLVLSVSLISLNLLSYGLFYGFLRGALLGDVTYIIGNAKVYGGDPYQESISLYGIIFLLSIIAFFSLLIERRVFSIILRSISVAIIVLLYLLHYVGKLRVIDSASSYLDLMRETLYFDLIGFSLALVWGLLEIYSFIKFRRQQKNV
jgi:hypothetical protein